MAGSETGRSRASCCAAVGVRARVGPAVMGGTVLCVCGTDPGRCDRPRSLAPGSGRSVLPRWSRRSSAGWRAAWVVASPYGRTLAAGPRITRNRAMVPGARETVQADSVASGRRSAPYPPSGHRRRRGYLGPFPAPVAPRVVLRPAEASRLRDPRPGAAPYPLPGVRATARRISRPGSPGGRASRVCGRRLRK